MSRAFYIRLTKADFPSASNTTWESMPIDAYVNESYINYSTVKSSYGLELIDNTILQKFVWVGMKRLSSPHQWSDFTYFTWNDLIDQTWVEEGSLHTDTGEIYYGRYIDKSGAINVINYVLNLDTPSAVASWSLDVYQSDSPYSIFPDEWVKVTADVSEINIAHSQRYLKFVLNFVPFGPSFGGELLVRVEIEPPVMVPMYQETRRVLDKFPRWMAIRQFPDENPATPTLATPNSLGGNLINDISGEWLDDLSNNIQWLSDQRFIDTVDLTQKAWAYRTDGVPAEIWHLQGDNGPPPGWDESGEWDYIWIGMAVSELEFLEATEDEDVAWWDEGNDVLYVNRKYGRLVINGVAYPQVPYHVWNWLDDIGLSVDLPRLTLEENERYRLRILDVYRNFPGAGIDQFKLAVRRELDLWRYAAAPGATPSNSDATPGFEFLVSPPPIPPATPDSAFLGATPEILEMSDIEKDFNYVDPDGMPTTKFRRLVDKLSREYPVTWGRFRWDKAVWDVSGPNFEGFTELPYRMDATPVPTNQIQSGIGDGDDLFVFRPDVITGPHQFSAKLRARGRKKIRGTEYPPVTFHFNLWGEADKVYYQNPPLTMWFTLALTSNQDGRSYFTTFQLTSRSDVDATNLNPSQTSWATETIFDVNDVTLLQFYDDATGTPYPYTSDHRVPMNNISGQLRMYMGEWIVSQQQMTNQQTTDTFAAWFSDNPSTTLTYHNAGLSSILMNSGSSASFQMESKIVISALGRWRSETIAFQTTLNDVPPFTEANAVSIQIPNINWDNNLASPSNQVYRIELADVSGPPSGTNLLSDNDSIFISDITGWSAFVSTLSMGIPPVHPPNGQNALKVESIVNTSAAAIGPEFAVSSGNQYTVTASFLCDTTSVSTYCVVRFDWYDSSHQYLSSSLPSPVLYDAKDKWALAQTTQTAPLNAAYGAPILYINTDVYAQNHWVNNIRVTAGNTISQYGATVNVFDGNDFFLPAQYLSLNGSNGWINNFQYINGSSTELIWNTTSPGDLYPLTGSTWTLFENEQLGSFNGIVDQNGPWRNNQPSGSDNIDDSCFTATVARADFGVPDSSDYVVTWMGVDLVDGDDVIVWLDFNLVSTAVDDPYDEFWAKALAAAHEGVIQERYNNGEYFFDPFVIRARLNLDVNQVWNPSLHTGWAFEGDQEYYVYAQPVLEQATGNSYVLSGLARQGAPILAQTDTATPVELRQVTFFDTTATPTTLRLDHTQIVPGNGTDILYLAYEDVYNLSVVDNTSGLSIGVVNTQVLTNQVQLTSITHKDRTYSVNYVLNNSFYADSEHQDDDHIYHTQLVFDKNPSQATPIGLGYSGGTPSSYEIVYEGSIFNPAIPIDAPLNPLYTTLNEGFIFISHHEYTLDRILVYVTPSQIVADAQDYILVNIYSQDQFENPKPNQVISLSSTWGSFVDSTVVTDQDGFGVATLIAEPSTDTLAGVITLTSGDLSMNANFLIQPSTVRTPRLLATVYPNHIPADGKSSVTVYGKVEDQFYQGAPDAIVTYRVARSIYELFGLNSGQEHTVTTGVNGFFEIGPIVSAPLDQPGLWFMTLECDLGGMPSTPPSGAVENLIAGTLVFWNEYPDTNYGAENMTGLPRVPIQMATPISPIPPYATPNLLPVYYDDASPFAPPTTITHIWSTPIWYIIRNNIRYQIDEIALRGSGIQILFDIAALRHTRPAQWRGYI